MANRLWILGAAISRLAAIESLLAEAGERVAYATVGGVRVHPGNAYEYDGHLYVCSDEEMQGRIIFQVECDYRRDAAGPSGRLIQIDHHRHGDPGYGKPPGDFLTASSIGQVLWHLTTLGVAPESKGNNMKLDAFTLAYIECALWSMWSSTDKSNERGCKPMDKNYSIEDIALETLSKMAQDCYSFHYQYEEYIVSNEKHAGHDFWLTRNGHGAGFWDGGWPKEAGEKLTIAAKSYGYFNLYVGDDGKIYGMKG